jgi:hypothetical protein
MNAFPYVVFNSDGEVTGGSDGMSLKDFFAAHALQGLLAAHRINNVFEIQSEEIVDEAYDLAEMMLEVKKHG